MNPIADTPEGRTLRYAINIINSAISANNNAMLNNDNDTVHEAFEHQLSAYVAMKNTLVTIMKVEGLEYPGFLG